MKKHFIYWLAFGFLVIAGCQKELSFEGGDTPSVGTLQSDITGDCLPKTVNGTYVAATALVPATNTISVQVDVIRTGLYTITTDTVNGYYFRVTGVFTALGINTVTLRSNGTPFAAGINNFVVSYNGVVCDIAVTVLPAGSGGPAVFAFAGAGGGCTNAVVNGSYSTNTGLTASNIVTLSINVTTLGTYNISTTFQGMTFAAAGAFITLGPQNVTLNGSGTPTTAGLNTVPITAGTSTCSFPVTVASPADGTLGATTGSCTPSTVNGTYIKDVALTAANTVQVQINVTTAGVYSVTTNTVAGFHFSGTGAVTVGPNQLITLAGGGTPTAAGTQTFTVTFGTSTCTFMVNVNGPAGAAVFAANCAGATVNGTYQAGTALTAANTITLPITVTTAGTYNISTTATNGMVFTGNGSLTLTSTSITLAGGGIPAAAASPSNIPMPGTSPCNVQVTVTAASGGAGAFTPDCTSAIPDGLYEATTQLNASNKVAITVNVTAIGPYNISTTPINGMTFSASGTFSSTGSTPITLVGSGTPAASGTFNIQMPGTTPCSFSLVVDPAPVVDWKFTVTNAPAITYQGQTDDAQLIAAAPPSVVFGLSGSNSLGSDNLTILLSDVSGTIANGETYSTSGLPTGNFAVFQYDLATGTDSYKADPSQTGVTMTFTVITHNVAAKTITGTFSGTAKNNAGQTITITAGTFFSGTYH